MGCKFNNWYQIVWFSAGNKFCIIEPNKRKFHKLYWLFKVLTGRQKLNYAAVPAFSAAMRKNVFLSVGQQPKPSIGRLIVDVPTSHEIRHTHQFRTNITWLEINSARRLELRDTAWGQKIMLNFLLTTPHVFVICTYLYPMGYRVIIK